MLRWRGRQDRHGSERGWEGLRVGEASCEAERDEKEVNGAGHAEVEVDDLNTQCISRLREKRARMLWSVDFTSKKVASVRQKITQL